MIKTLLGILVTIGIHIHANHETKKEEKRQQALQQSWNKDSLQHPVYTPHYIEQHGER